MEGNERLDRAFAARRKVLGDAYVDAQVGDPDPIGQEFQEYLTEMAWGVWSRGGALSHRDGRRQRYEQRRGSQCAGRE